MSYKYKIGDYFKIIKNGNVYNGKIIKIAEIDEFGADFYYDEKNYVVKFYKDNKEINNEAIASYNFLRNNTYEYLMTENEILNI